MGGTFQGVLARKLQFVHAARVDGDVFLLNFLFELVDAISDLVNGVNKHISHI